MMVLLLQENKTALNGAVAVAQVELQVLVHLAKVAQDWLRQLTEHLLIEVVVAVVAMQAAVLVLEA
jgi:predicted RNA-binding protein with RPS1 domain